MNKNSQPYSIEDCDLLLETCKQNRYELERKRIGLIAKFNRVLKLNDRSFVELAILEDRIAHLAKTLFHLRTERVKQQVREGILELTSQQAHILNIIQYSREWKLSDYKRQITETESELGQIDIITSRIHRLRRNMHN